MFEMPGWTLQALSPGARKVLGNSPFGSYQGQEILNGFVHWKDVELVEGMWVRALATGSAASSCVRILQSRRRDFKRDLETGAGRAHEAPVECSSSDCCHHHSSEWCIGDPSSAEFLEEEGIYPLLPDDAMLQENDDLWHLDSPGKIGNLDEFFAADSDCAASADGPCAAPDTRQADLDSVATTEGGGRLQHGQCLTSHRFEHRFVSLRAEIFCQLKHAHGRKQVGMLLAPLDTASPWLLGTSKGDAGGCEGTCGEDLATCAREQAQDPEVAMDLVWEDSEEDRQDEMAATQAALSGVYKFDWEHSTSNGLTPGDMRQFLFDLSAANKPDALEEAKREVPMRGAKDLQCAAPEASSDSAKETVPVRGSNLPV